MDKLRKMQNVAESRRNMKVDLRPSVVAKTMTKELVLVSISLLAVISKFKASIIFTRSTAILSKNQADTVAI